MNEPSKKISPPVFGGISLLMVFAVLCLTVFTLLTLSTVRADMKLSDGCAETVSQYYEADLKAEETFAQIRASRIPEFVNVNDGVYSYTQQINDTSYIFVEIKYEDNVWKVITWQTVSNLK